MIVTKCKYRAAALISGVRCCKVANEMRAVAVFVLQFAVPVLRLSITRRHTEPSVIKRESVLPKMRTLKTYVLHTSHKVSISKAL
jgi:hypothetical protein